MTNNKYMYQAEKQLPKEQNKWMTVHISLHIVENAKQKNGEQQYYWSKQTSIMELIDLMYISG